MSLPYKMTARQLDVHNVVRDTPHRAMLRHKTQREAFDLALAVVLRRLALAPGTERQAVAVMLANEPSLPDALSSETAGDEAVMRPRRSGHRITGSAR